LVPLLEKRCAKTPPFALDDQVARNSPPALTATSGSVGNPGVVELIWKIAPTGLPSASNRWPREATPPPAFRPYQTTTSRPSAAKEAAGSVPPSVLTANSAPMRSPAPSNHCPEMRPCAPPAKRTIDRPSGAAATAGRSA
jgi:hypothetical protein